MIWTLLVNVFCGVKTFICWAAGFTSGISNESVSLILWWIIVVILTIIVVVLILVIFGIMGFLLEPVHIKLLQFDNKYVIINA